MRRFTKFFRVVVKEINMTEANKQFSLMKSAVDTEYTELCTCRESIKRYGKKGDCAICGNLIR